MEKEWYKLPNDIDSVKTIILKHSVNRIYKSWKELLKSIDELYWAGDTFYSPFESAYNDAKEKANKFYRQFTSILGGIQNGNEQPESESADPDPRPHANRKQDPRADSCRDEGKDGTEGTGGKVGKQI